ncbi:bifunctional 3-(3-hydroxy-phenyl)propionate/3-hydroxycinnamic acid hydroxylase [Sphingomonas sp. LB3N6]|uniref:bifunctional 3-(3-hydroxy-phenyl)propionate/3-hydroxycinnamic acid hydroxylase n=1 Tax=Sphingomonas fucosidasi TaxID=3096164 RepID=UPI002FC58D76
MAANLLGRFGLKTVAIERAAEPFPLPRAVHLDHEMMRLFQAAGVAERVSPDVRDTDGHLHIGADNGVIRYMGTVGRPRPFGWSNDYFFYQPELENHLRGALAELPTVSLRLGTEVVGLSQDDDGVTLQIRDAAGDAVARARWVIGCDGARSTVRKLLNVALEDLDFEEPWLVVDAEVDGAVRFPPLTGVPDDANLQKLSVMMCDPVRPCTVVPGRGNHRRWEFMLLPGEDDATMMQPESVSRLIDPWLSGVPHRIVRATTYRFHGLVAKAWHVGGVFLAGDAAHQTPPFFGQGMCHGMRDVANLAWKIDHVARGAAPLALLDTYQQERDPHVRAVITAAVDAGRYICMLDAAAAADRDAAMRKREANGAATSTAADLIPPIRDGVVAGPSVGERFIQPRMGDGRLLDTVTGGGWRLFTTGSPAGAGLPDAIHAFDVTALDDGGAVQAWLSARNATAVLVRPDFYVFGLAAGDLTALIGEWSHRVIGSVPIGVAA